MEAEQKVGAVQLSTRLRGVSPPVTRRLRVTEQTSLAELHALHSADPGGHFGVISAAGQAAAGGATSAL